MELAIDTYDLHRSFVEEMATCTAIDYDLDEYASAVISAFNSLLDTNDIDDAGFVIEDLIRFYSLERYDRDQKIFSQSFRLLFKYVIESIMSFDSFEKYHYYFQRWTDGSLIVSVEKNSL